MGADPQYRTRTFRKITQNTRRHQQGSLGDVDEGISAGGRRNRGSSFCENSCGQEVNPYYTHSYGKFVPELIHIDKQLREIMFGGEE
jgi:hypothetical protein